MKKQILILTLIIALLLIVSIFALFLFDNNIVGRAVQEENSFGFDYVYTKAICDDNNNCRDFEIACLDGEAIRMDPVTGMVIFPDDWVDGRSEEDKELCE
jgi:hypothetical protein